MRNRPTSENTLSRATPHKFEVTVPEKKLRPRDRIRVEDSYRVRHDDGSLTWGYKSADGSFKEETIGADCITRGRQVSWRGTRQRLRWMPDLTVPGYCLVSVCFR